MFTGRSDPLLAYKYLGLPKEVLESNNSEPTWQWVWSSAAMDAGHTSPSMTIIVTEICTEQVPGQTD